MILYIDTCYKILNIALYENQKVLLSFNQKLENNMTDLTLIYINKLFEQTKKDISSLSKVIVSNGPGSFTGIRIGLTIAKTIAYALNIPIITISKLTTMALSSNSEYKVPIIVQDRDNLIVFPTTSPFSDDCIWINLKRRQSIRKKQEDQLPFLRNPVQKLYRA